MSAVNKLLAGTAQPRPIDIAAALALPKRERARLAVDYLNGIVVLELGIPVLPTLLGISASLVYQEKLAAEREAATPDLASTWANASEDERAELLDRIRATAPAPQAKSTNGHTREPQQERRFSTLPPVIIRNVG